MCTPQIHSVKLIRRQEKIQWKASQAEPTKAPTPMRHTACQHASQHITSTQHKPVGCTGPATLMLTLPALWTPVLASSITSGESTRATTGGGWLTTTPTGLDRRGAGCGGRRWVRDVTAVQSTSTAMPCSRTLTKDVGPPRERVGLPTVSRVASVPTTAVEGEYKPLPPGCTRTAQGKERTSIHKVRSHILSPNHREYCRETAHHLIQEVTITAVLQQEIETQSAPLTRHLATHPRASTSSKWVDQRHHHDPPFRWVFLELPECSEDPSMDTPPGTMRRWDLWRAGAPEDRCCTVCLNAVHRIERRTHAKKTL